MISYEVSISFILGVCGLALGGSLSFAEFALFGSIGLPMVVGSAIVGGLLYISFVAETNRHPFDLPEAESELVSGYNVEYSSGLFALFFLGEYASILLMSAIWCTVCISVL